MISEAQIQQELTRHSDVCMGRRNVAINRIKQRCHYQMMAKKARYGRYLA